MRPSSLAITAAGCAALLTCHVVLAAGDLKFQSRDGHRASLIELYTSEGCSSCPPAEAWLSRFTTSPQLWTEVVPVAFHVNYWDNLGWRDRFASLAWTARQRAYAASWGGDTIYTPGFVRDGREWRQWGSSVSGAPPAPGKGENAGGLSVVVKDGKTVAVTYHIADRRTAQTATVALLGCDLNSNVKAGENSGKSLRHDFVVLACETKPLVSGGSAEYTTTFELPVVPAADAKRLGLAVWVEETGRAGIQQATGGWLTGAAPN